MKTCKTAMLAALAACTFAFAAKAETYTWVGGGTTTADWNERTNWSPEGVPNGGDMARIVRGSDNVALTITFTSDFAVNGGVLTIENHNVLTFSGVISGTGSLAINNYGNLTITGSNTFTGDFTAGGSGFNYFDSIANGGVASSVGAGYGEVTLNGGRSYFQQSCETDRTVVGNAAYFVKNGGGYLPLGDSRAAFPVIQVVQGRIDINYDMNPVTATPRVVEVKNSSVLGGTGEISIPVSMQTTSVLAAGTPTAAGTLTLKEGATLTFAGGTRLRLRLGADASDAIVADAVTVSGTVTVDPQSFDGSPIPNGTYTLMTYASINNKNLFALAEGFDGELVVEDHALKLVRSVGEEILVWQGDGVANAWGEPSNWTGGTLADGKKVVFDDTGDDSLPVTIASAVAPSDVKITASTQNYVFAGAGISGTTAVTKSGASSNEFANANTFTGGYTATAGATVLSGSFAGTPVTTASTAYFTETATGAISGGSNIALEFGPAGATLRGKNASFTGTFVFNGQGATRTASYVISGQSLGTPSAINVRMPANAALGLTFDGAVDTHNAPIEVTGDAVSRDMVLTRTDAVGDQVFGGDLRVVGGQGPHLRIETRNGTSSISIGRANATMVISGFAGGIDRIGTCTLNYYGRLVIPSATYRRNNGGTDNFYASSNEVGVVDFLEGTIRLHVDDAFTPATKWQMGKDWANLNSTLDLNGHRLVIGSLNETYKDYDNRRQITSIEEATLEIVGDGAEMDSSFGDPTRSRGSISGAVSLVKSGTATLTLAGTNTFTGTVTVKGGVLAAAAECALPTTATVFIAAKNGQSGVLRLDAPQTVTALYIGGRGKASGTYGAAGSGARYTLPCFAGSAVLTVTRNCAKGMFISVR